MVESKPKGLRKGKMGGERVLQYVLCLWLLRELGAPNWCEVLCWVAVVLAVLNVAIEFVKGIADLK